jgi:hypothetical protein
MTFALILMIKNESRILQRCLQAVENVVDYFCILDTGSTDNSVEIANEFLKTHKGCVNTDAFKDFGYSRTKSFENAQKYLKDEGLDLTKIYGLLLDADMIFVPGILKQQTLTAIGYKIIQLNGGLEYYNCRIVRMDYPWKCIGVTHEYWSGPTENMEKSICYIDDKNDGGCKQDKFQRDIKLLEEGLEKEAKNERYMFYLAQTFKCVGRFKDAISMYKKRIAIGGWAEEIWHSHYSIGECYLKLKDLPKVEEWMLRAFAYRPCRTESIYQLARVFREMGQHYKSYHYIKIGQQVPFPKNDCLFIESSVYNGLFDYECSIVEYYIHPEKCLRTTIQYMLKLGDFQQNCVTNLKFSIKPVESLCRKVNIQNPFGNEFRPSAISVVDYPFANARFVNYLIQPNGSYIMPNDIVVTKNAYVNIETGEAIAMRDPTPLYETNIRGIEDLRLYKENGKLMFTSTSYKEYLKDKISIVQGEYDLETHALKDCKAIRSPTNSDCEKNWVNIEGTDEFIYGWNPLQIGKIRGDRFYFNKEYRVPPLFSLFRGSSPAIKWEDDYLVLVHFVEYCQPRKYYHCFVRLSRKYEPLSVSLPFCFKSPAIEFCVSTLNVDNTFIDCFASLNDCNPHTFRIAYKHLEWIKLVDKPVRNSIVRVPPNIRSYWDGGYSKCIAGGSIENYVNTSIQTQNLNVSAIFSMSDGFVDKTEFNNMEKQLGRAPTANTCEDDYRVLEIAANEDTYPIVCMLCSRFFNKQNALLLPLDDATFSSGLNNVLSNIFSPKWENRISNVFWRGGSSGFDRPSIRMKVTDMLYKNTNANVRLTKWGNWENEKSIPEEHFGDRCGLDKHFLYKYILIIDGNLIASNHQWVFGSGSVPIMITHPENNYWFKNLLKPMEHYVPIKYDLSDLEEKIQWLVDNDEKAKEIANNALRFSNEVFCPSFQRKYIDNELLRISKLNNETPKNVKKIEKMYLIKSHTPSDINEHLPTLLEYTKKCDSVVECGVHDICSSYAFAYGLSENQNNKYLLVDPYKSKHIDGFIELCKSEAINATFLEKSDLECPLVETDLLFIDTWHVYGQLKRELAYWHSSVKKYIIMHDTTVDEWAGEAIRARSNGIEEANKSGFPLHEVMKGLWPAIEEFLEQHPEWKIEKRYTNNNGLTILTRST